MREDKHALGPNWRIFWITAPDGTALRCGVYAQTKTPQRYQVFSTGRGEYIEKYGYLPGDLQLDPDTAFLLWDHRGQGASGGVRFHITNYDQYVEDMAFLLQEIVGLCPYTMLAHSMGSLIVLRGLLTRRISPQRVFLSAPLLGFRAPAMAQWAIGHFLSLAKHLSWDTKRWAPYGWKQLAFEDNPFTHSPERFAIFLQTPYPSDAMTFSWISATQQAMQQVFHPAALLQLSTPVHLLLAGEDHVVENAESLRWFARANQHAACKPTMEWIPGARHELFFEGPPYYNQVVAAVGFR